MPKAIDTNGAGDTFATVYMMAAMRGDPSPGSTASWAASRAVLQPQTCKPRCAPLLISAPGGVPVLTPAERVVIAAVPLLQHLVGIAAGVGRQLVGVVPVQVPMLQQAVDRLEELSSSSSWGRDVSSMLSSAVGLEGDSRLGSESTTQVVSEQAAGGSGVVAAATAVPHSAEAGVEH